MKIAVLDYGIGNLRSAEKALQHVGGDAALTADVGAIDNADAVVLPGVGHFGRCMKALRASGLEGPAWKAVRSGKPFIGICIGMQMLYESSDEDASTSGMGVLPGKVRLLPEGVKRPQMQWNMLNIRDDSPMFAGLERPLWMYFVHSFAPATTEHVVATCDYGGDIVAAIQRDNLWATQFHPEKSGGPGLQVLANFVAATR
ncbi:MAG TPA: imidazole glycerol phosphate synthase subunit HisH [Acidimicrobiales bacterium]|jgi:glutamine amidotransferase|nr:imidazole glycerol phosphate synthase subunit HisH [Acidimicrobiales bacterium]